MSRSGLSERYVVAAALAEVEAWSKLASVHRAALESIGVMRLDRAVKDIRRLLELLTIAIDESSIRHPSGVGIAVMDVDVERDALCISMSLPDLPRVCKPMDQALSDLREPRALLRVALSILREHVSDVLAGIRREMDIWCKHIVRQLRDAELRQAEIASDALAGLMRDLKPLCREVIT